MLRSEDTENDGTSRRKFVGVAAMAGGGLVAALFYQNILNAEKEDALPEGTGENSVLIVYLTRTKNTEVIAEIIHQEVSGDMIEVEPVDPYPENYDAIVSQVDEENESGYVPPLKGNIEDIQGYETVFFGFPTWDMQLPPPMKAFLREYDLGEKTVIPFNTNGGYGIGSGFQTIEDRCPDANVREGFSTRGGLERDEIYLAIKGERREEVHAEVTNWLGNIRV